MAPPTPMDNVFQDGIRYQQSWTAFHFLTNPCSLGVLIKSSPGAPSPGCTHSARRVHKGRTISDSWRAWAPGEGVGKREGGVKAEGGQPEKGGGGVEGQRRRTGGGKRLVMQALGQT